MKPDILSPSLDHSSLWDDVPMPLEQQFRGELTEALVSPFAKEPESVLKELDSVPKELDSVPKELDSVPKELDSIPKELDSTLYTRSPTP